MMPADFTPGQWAVILGGSSGFGLAIARVLAHHGVNLCIVHRDRRSQLARIAPEIEKLRGAGVSVRVHNRVAWRGYAAVSAAKVALESLARSIAVEYAPHGIRCDIIQPGITDKPALDAIPGSDQMKAQARMRNPFHRLTTPMDVDNPIHLFSLDDAAWMNGAVIRVDGGEHTSGVLE